jgi:serine acetyltransferase
VGVGSVVTDRFDQPSSLIAGVPARVIKLLSEHDAYLVERKTRADLPDDV